MIDKEIGVRFGIEIKVGKKWIPARPATSPPYEFGTKEEAKTMARILYPDQVIEAEAGGPEVVRVVPKE